jgi:putative tryptophan/tyrosine transport system substrate-binding protein
MHFHQLKRRELIKLMGSAAATWPLAARAEGRKIPLVGVLWHAGSAEEEAIYLGAFLEGLKGLNYIEGKTIILEHRFPNETPERFVSLAAELAALNPQVLVAVTRPAATAAQRATTVIPIVFIVVPDPVGTKLVQRLSHPGGNITGFTHIAVELSAKRLALFKDAFPRASKAALLLNANDPQGMRRYLDESQPAALALGIAIQPVEVRSLADFTQAFEKIATDRLDGVVVPADGLFYQGRGLMARLAVERGLPLIVYSRETLEAGALMSYGADQRTIFRRAAIYIDKIIKAEKPADLPVEQPTRFEMLINLKTAKTLGLSIPESFLSRADEVIE